MRRSQKPVASATSMVGTLGCDVLTGLLTLRQISFSAFSNYCDSRSESSMLTSMSTTVMA